MQPHFYPLALVQHVLSENARGQGRGGDGEDDDKAESDSDHGEEAAEAIAEYRVRLISGLKRYFHSKHEQVCARALAFDGGRQCYCCSYYRCVWALAFGRGRGQSDCRSYSYSIHPMPVSCLGLAGFLL